jgi:hypothetical protein
LWLNYFFCPEVCSRCTDYLGHRADIAVGDRTPGWNSVITWNHTGESFLGVAVELGYLEAREVPYREFLKVVMTPYVQKELRGGYRRFWAIRHRRTLRWLPVPVLRIFAGRIYQRTVSENREFQRTQATGSGVPCE